MLVFGVLAIVANDATVAGGLVPLLVGLLVLVIGLARWPDGLSDQPGPRSRAADHLRVLPGVT